MVSDQVQLPMVISATAVFITLLYASVLDIRERRVPFRTWLPMLTVGLAATCYLFWEQSGNAGLVCGYLAVVVAFLYADYLDNRGTEDSTGLAGYYQRPAIFYYLPVVLVLPAISWCILAGSMGVRLIPWYVMFAGIVTCVSYIIWQRDDETSRIKRKKARKERKPGAADALIRWYFVLIIVIFVITSMMMFYGPWGSFSVVILFISLFCGIFWFFGFQMHFFGGADAWALIFIAFCIPVFPVTPLLGASPIGFFAFSVLINALILNLAAPLGIFLVNLVKGNRAPLMYMFFGFPVNGNRIRDAWGFVMEEFEEKEGIINRRFIGFWDSIRRMYSGEGRIYTKELRENPDAFTRELGIYSRAGTVWISYAVPFIIPIAAGFLTAAVIGDFLFIIMKFLAGA